jgi:1-aminocyclopropane-1-carboxylate deaminase/D-cysteine desulfhydrase-like pyridoxal-dependent ACC family enzyme
MRAFLISRNLYIFASNTVIIYQLWCQALTNILKEKLLKEGRRPYVIPVGGSDSLGTW